jgi:glycosyltransferase involved in cell wall biosynthesis
MTSSPRPVLLLSYYLAAGGTERQLAEMAKGLDRRRFEPHVGCLRAEGIRREELLAAGVPLVEFPVPSFRSPLLFREWRRLGHYVEKHRIAIVHSFDPPSTLLAVPAARWFRAPVVLSSQRAQRRLTPGVMHQLLRLTDRLVDGIVVNTRAVRGELIEEDRVPASKIHLCYNGIDTETFRPLDRRIPPDDLVIGVLCGLRREKAIDTLIQAFAAVRRPGMKLVIVGEGVMRDSLAALAQQLGVAADCHFEPTTSDAAGWLRSMDIFVLPSLSEALSNSLMEAMACGCCAVASRVGGNPELVRDGETGLLFRPGDAPDLAAKLNRLIGNPGLRRELACAGAQYLHQEFSLARSVRRMEEIYEACLKL